MSSNVTSKPLVKPLKGNLATSNGVFGTLVATGISIPGLFEGDTIFNLTIEDSVINNTIIGGEFPSIATFTTLNVTEEFRLLSTSGSSVYWDTLSNVFNVNTNLVVTGCSRLGNLMICENYIRAENLNGDISLIPRGFGTVFIDGPVETFASNGNFSVKLANGSFLVSSTGDIKLDTANRGATVSSLQSQNYTTQNGGIILKTDIGIGQTNSITNIAPTTGGILVTTSTRNNLVAGGVIDLTSPVYQGMFTIGNVVSPTQVLVTGYTSGSGIVTSGTLVAAKSNDILLDPGRYIVVPENKNIVLGSTLASNTVSGSTSGLLVYSSTGITLLSDNVYVSQGSVMWFGTSSSLEATGAQFVLDSTVGTYVRGPLLDVDTTHLVVTDPIVTIGDYVADVSDLKDRGIEYRYTDTAGNIKLGWFGYDKSIDSFAFIPDATNTNEVISGAYGNARFNRLDVANTLNLQCSDLLNVSRMTGCNGTILFSAANILLSATSSVLIPSGVPLALGTSGSSITGSTSGGISVGATSVNLPAGVPLGFGTSGSSITGNTAGTTSITGTSILVPSGVPLTLGTSGSSITGDTVGATSVAGTTTYMQSPTVVLNVGSYIGFNGTSNSVTSDGTNLILHGFEAVNLGPDVNVSGDVYIGGTLRVANFDASNDINRYIFPFGTEQRLSFTSITNSSSSGILLLSTVADHYYVPGDSVRIANTDTDPVIEGIYTVNTIVDNNTYTVVHLNLASPGGAVGYSGSVLTYDHGKDVGLQLNFWSTQGATAASSGSINYQTGFIGFKNDSERLVYYHDATISSNVVTNGNLGDFEIGKLFAGGAVINTVDVTPSLGDIGKERASPILNNQTSLVDIANFLFPNATVRAFDATVSIEVFGTTSNLYACHNLRGIQKNTGTWVMNTTYIGDTVGVKMSVSSTGQIKYTSVNKLDFTSATAKFRAFTTSI